MYLKQFRFWVLVLAIAAIFPVIVSADQITVDTTDDNDNAFDLDCTLREAINNANSDSDTTSGDCAAGDGNDTIDFSLSGTITLDSQLEITDGLTIDGTGQAVTISGNNAVRVMQVLPGVALHVNALTIANGNASSGGGILSLGTLNVTNSTFSGNSAFHGGAIDNLVGTLTVTNSTFSGNSATTVGGGIFNETGGTLTVTNSTFSGNSAPDGAGGGIANSGFLTMHLLNTIIANSSGGDCVSGIALATNTNNLIEDNSCSPAFSGDPMLDPAGLDNNGGPTQTIALLTGSTAIDQGDATTCANAPVNNLDQRGFARPVDGDPLVVPGAICDIGAFEFGATGDVPILLIIDADTINNGIKSIQNISTKAPFCGDGSSSVCVNDDIADPGVRELLFTRGNDITPYSGLVLPGGKKGDEGMFQFTNPDLQISQQNGSTFTIQEFIFAQGAASNENNLDKVSGVQPLTAAQITDLEGKTVCAVVYDSDISVDRKANFASLKGSTLGLTAFTVTAVTPVSKALPKITVDLLDSSEVLSACAAVLPPPVPATASITIIKDVQPNVADNFNFTATGQVNQNFSLVDNGVVGPDRITFSGLTGFGAANSVIITEPNPGIYSLIAISFQSVGTGVGSFSINIPNKNVTIILQPDASVVCTFVNAFLNG